MEQDGHPEFEEMAQHRPKLGPYQTAKSEPEFESVPGKTAMDAIKAILWIPDAAAKILLLASVVFLGWQLWGLKGKVTALEAAAIRTAEQRAAEMALLAEVSGEIKAYRAAVIAKSHRLLNDGSPQ